MNIISPLKKSNTLRKMKNNRAAGDDKIVVEDIKLGRLTLEN